MLGTYIFTITAWLLILKYRKTIYKWFLMVTWIFTVMVVEMGFNPLTYI